MCVCVCVCACVCAVCVRCVCAHVHVHVCVCSTGVYIVCGVYIHCMVRGVYIGVCSTGVYISTKRAVAVDNSNMISGLSTRNIAVLIESVSNATLIKNTFVFAQLCIIIRNYVVQQRNCIGSFVRNFSEVSLETSI